jgi:hypothetical protein
MVSISRSVVDMTADSTIMATMGAKKLGKTYSDATMKE